FSKAKKKYFIDLNPPLRLHSFTRLTGKASEHLPKVVNELLLTKKYITSIKIADEINQWLHRKGDDVQNYEHFLDRVMDIRAIV
ncbi:hypothetical protein, partial [Klebsiella pneumoniae]|uniref:hypothetical protein n=1 Tax=Klebsiella pneumoniae TaxID=573 RepID=UPI003013CEB9